MLFGLAACERGPSTDSGSVQFPETTGPGASGGPEYGADTLQSAVSRLRAAALREDDAGIEAQMAAVAAFGASAIDPLGQFLADPVERARLVAVGVLAQMDVPEVVSLLLGALGDQSGLVRLAVVEALGRLRDPRAVQPLLTRLGADDDPLVRYACLTSLGLLGDPVAAPRLATATRSGDPYVRMWSIDALCEMGDATASEHVPRVIRDPNVYVRRQVLLSCPEAFGSQAGNRALVEATLDDPDFTVSVFARSVLVEHARGPGASGGARNVIVEVASRALVPGEGDRAIRAALLLGELGEAHALDLLTKALDHPQVLIRYHAAAVLGRLNDARAVKPLIRALDDASPLVRAAARDALRKHAATGNTEAKDTVEVRGSGGARSMRGPS